MLMKRPLILFILLTLHVSGRCQTTCNSFSTYFGGTQSDEIKSLCMDSLKNTYVIGNTYSTDLPVTPGLIHDTYSGNYDGFISKFDSCGGLVWCTYLGGSNFDSAEKITTTGDGNLVFCGYTSSLNTFTSTGCFQPVQNGSYDCFITKIDPSGHIIWSTYFGKSGGDFAFDLKADRFNHIIIGGTTTSANLYTTSGSFQPTISGNTDAFIARFSPDGLLKWCTYYGGNNSEDIHAIALDDDCNIIGAGGSFSTNLNTSAGAFQNVNDGSNDVYLIKLDSSGARLFSTYIGGGGVDDTWGLVCDRFSQIYLAGHTSSSNFDTTAGAYQTFNKGLNDWFITKWAPNGTLLKSTLFGGTANDNLARMVLSSPYELTLAGQTESNSVPMTSAGTQPANGGGYDVLIAKFNTISFIPLWASYYGGSMDEEIFDIVSYKSSFLEFTGTTSSTNFPLSASPYQAALNASVDGYMVKLNVGNLVPLGLQTITSNNSISVYPNPFKNTLYIKGEGVLTVSCVDLMGREVFPDLKTEDVSTLNTESLMAGIYVVTIRTSTEILSFKLIK